MNPPTYVSYSIVKHTFKSIVAFFVSLLAFLHCTQSYAQSLPAFMRETNWVFLPPQTFDCLKETSSGGRALIYWRTKDAPYSHTSGFASTQLLYREMSKDGVWEQPSTVTQDWGLNPAALFFDTSGTPHVFVSSGSVEHYRLVSGSWVLQRSSAPAPGGAYGIFMIAFGPQDTVHVMATDRDSWLETGPYWNSGYFTNLFHSRKSLADGGDWTTETVRMNHSSSFFQQSSSPRFYAMAVDTNNHVHAVCTPSFTDTPVQGGSIVNSKLAYCTDAAGYWTNCILYSPSSYGDAGLGASIAMSPSGRPAVASIIINRASTGSSRSASLLFHQLGVGGKWTATVIASQPDGYSAGDGALGTRFAPHLLFDSLGRPHIAFTDFAA
ncbi:MAG TPA: hypothetical protein VEC99_15395, partial [Clostridia bacterium]|nr:hypothetical protein [Clostridia bacterium]